jgi:hypothetical protein
MHNAEYKRQQGNEKAQRQKGIQGLFLRLGAFAGIYIEAKDSPFTIDHSP